MAPFSRFLVAHPDTRVVNRTEQARVFSRLLVVSQAIVAPSSFDNTFVLFWPTVLSIYRKLRHFSSTPDRKALQEWERTTMRAILRTRRIGQAESCVPLFVRITLSHNADHRRRNCRGIGRYG